MSPLPQTGVGTPPSECTLLVSAEKQQMQGPPRGVPGSADSGQTPCWTPVQTAGPVTAQHGPGGRGSQSHESRRATSCELVTWKVGFSSCGQGQLHRREACAVPWGLRSPRRDPRLVRALLSPP